MSGPKSNEPKGFLGTDDLDLDAWDATFDSLHIPGEQQGDTQAREGGEGGNGFGLEVSPEIGGVEMQGGGLLGAQPDLGFSSTSSSSGGAPEALSPDELADDFVEGEEFTAINDTGAVDDGPEYVAKALAQPYRPSRPVASTQADLDDEVNDDFEDDFADDPVVELPTAGGDALSADDLDDADAPRGARDDDDDDDDDGTKANLEMVAEEAGDFEDVSTVELGEAVMLAELDKFDKIEEAAKRRRAGQRTFAAVIPREARTRVDVPPPDADADVYTSAARPGNAAEAAEAAASPRISGRNVVSRTMTPQRTTSAIVRRRSPEASAHGFDGQESTRIAEMGELEPGMSASRLRQSQPVISRPTPPSIATPVLILEDDYADIEIESGPSASTTISTSSRTSSSVTPLPGRPPSESDPEIALSSPALVLPPAPSPGGPAQPRRTAHVLRRRGLTTKPPPSEAVVEKLTGAAASRPAAASPPSLASRGEDDFSDVMGDEAQRELGPHERTPIPSLRAARAEPGTAADRRGVSPPTAPAPISATSTPASRLSSQRDATESDDAAPLPRVPSVPIISTSGLGSLRRPGAPVMPMLPPDEDAEEVTTLIGSETKADVVPAPPSDADLDPDAVEDDFEDIEVGGGEDATRVGTRLGPPSEELDLTSAVIELRKPAASPSSPLTAPLAVVPMVPSRVKTPTSVPPMGRRQSDLLKSRPPTAAGVVFEDLPAGAEPAINLDKIALPAQLPPLAASGLDESFAQTLEIIEEDLQTTDDREGTASLRLEAGRLAERLGEVERARGHYESALLADPRLGAALRGLRRIALAAGDMSTATRQLDAELEVAGALEKRPLGHYRADLLMAAAEQDLARVAVGEMLDAAPSDVRALIAQLELAYLDGRYDELGTSLAQLAHAVSDPGLRAAADTARAVLATRPELHTKNIGSLFLAAAAADLSALMTRLAAARHLALDGEGAAAAEAMTQVAFQIALADKDVAAALAVRSLLWGAPDGAVDLAATAAPADPIVAQTMVEAASPSEAAAALSRCADRAPSLARRSYLAGLAAEIDLEHASTHWAHVLAADPGDDYAAAQLRTSHVASDATADAIEVDLAASQEQNRERSRLRGGFGLAGLGQMDRAISVLQEGRKARPNSLPIAEALAEVYAQGAMWRERAELFAELASQPGDTLDPELAAMRSALAWEDAATAAAGDDATFARRQAVAAWNVVLEAAPQSPVALGALISLARSLEDDELLRAALSRAHAVERIPWMSSSLALRRARHVELEDEGDSLLRDASTLGIDDPRRLTMAAWYAARRGDLDDIATAYDDRARALEEQEPPRTAEAASLRLRAAQLSVEANDSARAASLFAAVGEALPALSVVPDLLASARRRAGDMPVAATAVRRATPSGSGDEFARWIREGDYLAGQGDSVGAIALYQRALDLHPHDPLAAEPLRRLATAAGESAPIDALALGRLRNAEASGEQRAIADAYLVIADLDLNVRKDEGAARIALESAIKADPGRRKAGRAPAHPPPPARAGRLDPRRSRRAALRHRRPRRARRSR